MTTTNPDLESAATKATEILIKHQVSFAPIDPLPILKTTPGVLVLSFAEMANHAGVDRKSIIELFGDEGHDAATSVQKINGRNRYLVGYNQRLPFYLLQRALARELGHIILGHDGTKPVSVRMDEAICFAQHLLCPRALVKAIEEAGILITTEVIGNVTGCYERCLARMRKTEGVHIAPELNQMVKEQFFDYVSNFADIQRFLQKDDESMIANFGTFMDGYEE